MTGSSVEAVLREIGLALEPLADAVTQQPVPSGLAALLSEAGITTIAAGGVLADLCRDVAPLVQAVQSLTSDDAGPDASTLGSALRRVFASVNAFGQGAAGVPVGAGEQLVAHLLTDSLRRRHTVLYAALQLMGLMRETPDGVAGPAPRLEPARFPRLVNDLNGLMAEAYGWGTPHFADRRLLEHLQQLALALGFPALADVADRHEHAGLAPVAGHPIPGLRLVLATTGTAEAAVETGISVLPIRRDSDPAPGFAVVPFGVGAISQKIPLGDQWDLLLEATGETTVPFGLVALSGSFTVAAVSDTPHPVRAGMRIGIARSVPSDQSHTLLGDPHGTRLDVGTLGLFLELSADPFDFGVCVAGTQWRLVVQAGSEDGFLSAVLPEDGLSLPFDLSIGWSHRRGLYFAGGAGLRWAVPTAIDTGPVRITKAALALAADAKKPDAAARIRLSVALDARVQIGPFSAVVSEVGVQGNLAIGVGNANAGIGEFGLTAQRPTGVGLTIDTPTVSGGGFLRLEPELGRYAGVFELTLAGTVAIKAIALIATRTGGDSGGFALLILITADGFTPIQLGLGFSLTGIGGLLAINHTIDADAVRDGLHNGVLDSILFVKDPVKNADRIISTLDHVFPFAKDRLLIGPLAEISWGSPPLIKIRLALLLEIPQPVRVVLLAALSMYLPTPANAVVEIHIDAIGTLDLGTKQLALDASLHDSRILTFALTGDMALRLNWGDEPQFLMSIGGFHPKFRPPKGLRPLNRLALSLSGSNNPRIRFEAYLALTSNTIQMGARVDIHAEEAGFGIDGGGSFDGLIQWSPFMLDVAFAAWVKITFGGAPLLALSLSLNVTGPQPWHITGRAAVQVLFFSASVGIDLTIGAVAAAPEPVELIDVGAEIWSQLSDPARWQAILPASVPPGVTLAGVPQPSATRPLVAHPLATLSVRQSIAPLDRPVERVGARLPAGGTHTYSAAAVTPAGVDCAPVTDLFAPALYTDLPDDAALAGPSFETMTSGLSLRPAVASAAGPGMAWDFTVDTLDITTWDGPTVPGAPATVSPSTSRTPVTT
ncbi:DUF6603 domain-containing protein [Actinoplanes sp. NPDC049599]|uniref:DUF6603 domain-containing protein n=1 Tax=Actinoplanes sp. NPDC049599 TaxID=3363903 RepID=UPI003794CB43